MNIQAYNSAAWDNEVERGNQWTQPVSSEIIAAARRGEWQIVLTETKPVPAAWFPPIEGLDVLCLASGGGQQAPVLAAAGARVTVLDNSARQLAQDRFVAERDGLHLTTHQGDMAELARFADASFDLVFHPVSNLFVPEVRPVWREAWRVLCHGGVLLAGFLNPAVYIFDMEQADEGILQVRHALPYADSSSLTEAEKAKLLERGQPFEFSHTLTDQIGGQLDAGFRLTGFYEDHHRNYAPAHYMPTYVATKAIKP